MRTLKRATDLVDLPVDTQSGRRNAASCRSSRQRLPDGDGAALGTSAVSRVRSFIEEHLGSAVSRRSAAVVTSDRQIG